MPVNEVVVHRVDAAKTGDPDVTSYTVTANTLEEHPRIVQFQTVSQWESSLCQQAIKPRTHLLIEWFQSAYGKDIVKVGPS